MEGRNIMINELLLGSLHNIALHRYLAFDVLSFIAPFRAFPVVHQLSFNNNIF